MLVQRTAAPFGKFEHGRKARTPLPLTSTSKAASRTHRNTVSVKVSARLDPYKTLGVSHGADEKEIKKAHRRLVLENHPDRNHGKEGVEVKFLAIQEAYEILTGKRRGKEVDSGPASGWDFHDWFWRFKFSRRQGSPAAQAPPPPEVVRERLREQLSGLKAKAAAKRAAGPRRTAHAAHARNPSEAAASSVWRSTTKNARTTQQKSVEHTTVHTAFAPQEDKIQQQPERLHAQATEFASAAVHQEEMPENENSQPATEFADSSSSSPSSAFRTASEQSEESTSNSTAGEDQHAWQSLLTRAVHVVHDLHHRHNQSVSTHAHRIQSHISSIGSKLSQRLQMHALHEIIPELTNNYNENTNTINFSQWKATGFRFSASATIGNAFGQHHRGQVDSAGVGVGVPSENELHVLFSNSLHHHHHHQREKSATTVAVASGERGDGAEQQQQQHEYPRMDSHSRKFADKEHVKTRLSTQLTGLKRRSALKREFE